MTKKYFNWTVISVVMTALVLMISFNAIAYTESRSTAGFDTDKSERTMIKEIYSQQKEILTLLREIKSMLRSSK